MCLGEAHVRFVYTASRNIPGHWCLNHASKLFRKNKHRFHADAHTAAASRCRCLDVSTTGPPTRPHHGSFPLGHGPWRRACAEAPAQRLAQLGRLAGGPSPLACGHGGDSPRWRIEWGAAQGAKRRPTAALGTSSHASLAGETDRLETGQAGGAEQLVVVVVVVGGCVRPAGLITSMLICDQPRLWLRLNAAADVKLFWALVSVAFPCVELDFALDSTREVVVDSKGSSIRIEGILIRLPLSEPHLAAIPPPLLSWASQQRHPRNRPAAAHHTPRTHTLAND